MRQFLIDNGLAIAGLTPTREDAEDAAVGCISLQLDPFEFLRILRKGAGGVPERRSIGLLVNPKKPLESV